MTRGGTDWKGKWDAMDQAQSAPAPGSEREIVRLPAGKAWLLRWAWLISTGMLILGVVLIVIVLSGAGHRIGL
jgi:hypothetical protein